MEETKKNSGLGTAGFVLGVIAICISFIPFINYISIIMGILAIIFGIIGTIKNSSKGMPIASLVLGILSLTIVYNSYKTLSDTMNTISDEISNITGVSTSNNTKSEETIKISKDDVIKGKDVEINIENVQFSQDVEPPVKNTFYTHYQVDDSSNTYLYLVLNCKNISTIDLKASSVANVIAKYNNAYTYNSFSTIPDNVTGFTYSNITNIKPLTSQQIYYLAEMPKSIEDETDTPLEVQIKVDDKTYLYQYR